MIWIGVQCKELFGLFHSFISIDLSHFLLVNPATTISSTHMDWRSADDASVGLGLVGSDADPSSILQTLEMVSMMTSEDNTPVLRVQSPVTQSAVQ